MRADIHDGQEHNVPFKGRIQKRKTYHLQIVTFGLQRAAGPYRCARTGCEQSQQRTSYSTPDDAGTFQSEKWELAYSRYPSGCSFVLDCANDRREYSPSSTSGDHL
jgi:hypothetical protein